MNWYPHGMLASQDAVYLSAVPAPNLILFLQVPVTESATVSIHEAERHRERQRQPEKELLPLHFPNALNGQA